MWGFKEIEQECGDLTGTHQILPWNSTSVKFKFHFNARPGLKLLLCFARKVGTRPKSSIILMTWQPFFTLHSKTRSRYHSSSLLHTIYHSLWLVHMYNVYHSTSNIMTPGILTIIDDLIVKRPLEAWIRKLCEVYYFSISYRLDFV